MNLTADGLDVLELITFHCEAADAERVSLVGDFNNWNAGADPMTRQRDGSWLLQVALPRGRHYYQFLVDGEPVLDPQAMCAIRQERHSKVSLIALS
jgi:1,4-alpha-glucan branching enzyme